METIRVEISADGSTKLSVKGVRGKGCDALTKPIEDALGGVADKVRTPEYNQQATQTTKAVQR